MIPPQTTEEKVIEILLEVNANIRRQTRYKEMNRSNKSRLQIKCEPFVVWLSSDAKPELIRTTRFHHHCGESEAESSSHGSSHESKDEDMWCSKAGTRKLT